ncbi:MAG: hypothetical protein WC100_14890 [Sterolibacterium sp.]
MPYDKKVSRAEPGLICLALDDSGSQGDKLPGTSDPKYQWVERYVGIILKELLSRSTDSNGDRVRIKPRYHIHTIIYGSHPSVWGQGVMDIQATVEKYANDGNSLGLRGNHGGTDGAAAMQQTLDFLKQAVNDPKFQQSFPPMVFHLTDGMSDSDPSQIAEQIKQLTTADGNVLVVNAFIGTQTSLSYQGPDDFPGYVDADEAGPNTDNIIMFNMSSPMPAVIRQNLIDDGIFPNLRPGARLFFDVRTKEMLKHVIQVVGSLGSRAERQVR